MPRTRDLTLIFVIVAFLAIAIGATVISQIFSVDENTSSLQVAETTPAEYEAVVVEPEELDRDAKLSAMREKVAAAGPLENSEPEPPQTSPNESEASSTPPEELVREVYLCPNYQAAQPAWSPYGIQFEEVEGALLVFRETQADIAPNPDTATSGTQLPSDSGREVLLQLPVRSAPSPSLACLPNDVVGVAQDGSLIRNNEASLYGVFGPDTLIGYALDGFPIYGTLNAPSDSCGGVMAPSGYRYHLSSNRDVVINCYSAPPVTL